MLQIVFVCLVVVIPLTLVVIERIKTRRIATAFRLVGARLGLEVGGSAPALTMSGVLRGVEVSLVQNVEYRYKKAPLMSYQVRARLPSKKELQWAPNDALAVGDYRSTDLTTIETRHDLPVVGGWVEYEADGQLDPSRVEYTLEMVVHSACAAAQAKIDSEEDETAEDE